MEVDYAAIGNRIRNLRKEKGWTQDELRDHANISKTHMSHIETGTTKLSLPTLIDLANALDTTVDNLLGANVTSSTLVFRQEIQDILSDCKSQELHYMVEALTLIKKATRLNKFED